jgi:hypothetical protein
MRNNDANFGWTALRTGVLALGLVAFSGAGFAQTKSMDKKPTSASQEQNDGMAKDAEGGGLKDNDKKGIKVTTGSGAMGAQKGQKKASSKEMAKDKVPTSGNQEMNDGQAKDAEGGGLKKNRQ